MSHANASTKPGSIPPPAQLSVLATLAIHPKHTSKIANLDPHDVASLSLSYLRNILAMVGPVNARLRDAFLFRSEGTRRRRSSDDFHRCGFELDEEPIRGKMAGGGSVWTRGQDFWRVLGWAFNCSALYPHRWRWWRPWLEYVVDVLEADYKERKRLDEESAGKNQHCEYALLQESLLFAYIMPKSSRSSPVKPVMSALFADGSSSSTSIYKEVFKNETKVASKATKKRKRGLDLDKDNFGDYDDDSSTGGSEPPTPEHRRTSARMVDDVVPWASSSLMETVPLRLRLFALVSKVSKTFETKRTALMPRQLSRAVDDVPDKCNIKVSDLYVKFVDKVAYLPLTAFSRLIAALHNHLDVRSVVAILQVLMPYLMLPAAPDPRNVDPEATDHNSVSPLILEKCYLPFAYKGVENNAKLSIVNETLLRIVWTEGNGCLKWTPSLQEAVEKGVKARLNKSAPRKNSRKDDGDDAAREMLRSSGNRLLALADLLKLQESEQK